MTTSKSNVILKTTRIPLWARVVIIGLAAFGLSQCMYWVVQWVVQSVSNGESTINWHVCPFFIGALLIGGSLVGIALTGDRLGFGLKRLIAAIIAGSSLVLGLAITGILFFKMGFYT